MALEGMYTTNLANFVLNSLQKRLSRFMGLFATNVSDTMPEQGSAVDVPIVALEGAAVDLADVSDDRENASITPVFSTTKKTVTLAYKPARGFYVDPWEAAAATKGLLMQSLAMKIGNCTGAIALAVIEKVLALITAANFTNSKTIVPAAFDKDDLIGLRKLADDLEWGDQDGGAALNAALWEALCKSLTGMNYPIGDALNTGMLPNVAGFPAVKNTRIPVAGTTTTEKLRGFACLPSAIAIAMRPLKAAEAHGLSAKDMGLAYEEALFDPVANVACTLSIWGKPSTKRLYHVVETWHGESVAMGDQLIRIREA